jgi:MftR C-terminal domain
VSACPWHATSALRLDLLRARERRGRTRGLPGRFVLSAARHFLLQPAGLLAQLDAGDPHALERLRTVPRVIDASPALQAREQRALSGYADALATLLAQETGAPADDVRARVAANAMMGVQRTLAFAQPRDSRRPMCCRGPSSCVDRVMTRTLHDLADLSAKGMPPGMVALDALTTVCDGTRTRDLQRDRPVLALAG